MRNKRTLQRGLSLLLAGGMALSSVGVTPVLAEEYETTPETVQATPETAAEETAEPEAEPASAEVEEEPAVAALSLEDSTPVAAYADDTAEDGSKTISIDFSAMENLDDLGGWQLLTSGGAVTLAADPADANSKALAIAHTSNKESGIQYDNLGISADDYRYVTISETFYLATPTKGGQFCLPYLFNGSTVGYTLLTDGTWDKYKAQYNANKNTKEAGDVKKDQWQTVDYIVDLQKGTFTVKVDGETTLENATARTAVNQLTKFKFYSDDGNRSTVYLKSVTIKAEKDDTNKEPDKVYPPHATEAATYYVSNNGNDDADGLTPATAWQTIDRVNAETFIPGDKLLFERGGKWDDKTLSPKGSGTETAYITIGAYGDADARPKIAANGKVNDAIYLYNQQYWEICDLDISNTVDGTTMVAGDTNPTGNVTERVQSEGEKLDDLRGIHIAGNDTPSLKGFNIHDVRVHDVTGYVSWIGNTGLNDAGIKNNYGFDGSKRTGGILIESLAPSVDPESLDSQYTVFSDITIADNEFVNNSFGGIIVKQYNNNKARNGQAGWANREGGLAGGAPDYYDANWHPHTNIVITGNYINQGASAYACNGVYLCGVKDSVVEKNVLEHIGTCGIELFYADNVVIQYNEVSDVQKKGGGADDNAIDPDWRATNILVQYNYVHDCGEGILLCGCQFNSGTVRYNLIQNITRWAYIHYSTGGNGKFLVHNNVFYRTTSASSKQFDGGSGGGIVSYTNNIFYDATGEGFAFRDCGNYYNNAYYGTGYRSDEKNPIVLTADPFVGTAPSLDRKGDTATGVLLEANGLQIKPFSGLAETGATKDANGLSLTDGLSGKGTMLNYSSLAASYGDTIVPITTKAYPVFAQEGTAATMDTEYTQANVNTAAPSIGMFERVLTEDDIILAGTVTDTVNTYADVPITVTVGDKTVETKTDASGSFLIGEGLTAGEATVTAVLDGKTYTENVTLVGGKSHNVTITVPLPQMPDPYPVVVMDEDFEDGLGAFNFPSAAANTDGQLVLTSPGRYKTSYTSFSDEIQSLTAVDFSYDFKFTAGSDKSGLQFRDSEGNLVFATCVKNTDLRTSTTAEQLTDDNKASANADAAEPKWTNNLGQTAGTVYTVRVHADFATGKLSYQIKEKDTGTIVAQQINVTTTAKNLAKVYNCDWWGAKAQYIDNFVLTTTAKDPEPTVDKTELQETVDKNTSDDKKEADYTADTWAAYQAALAKAQSVLNDANATQEDVDNARLALQQAADALKLKSDEPTESPKPSEQPTAAPTTKPGDSNSSNSSSNSTATATPKPTAAPKAADAPKATAAPAAAIPQTADSFPLVMLAVLALCSAAAFTGLVIRRKKNH